MNVHVASEAYEGNLYRPRCFNVSLKQNLTGGSFAYGEELTSSLFQLCIF